MLSITGDIIDQLLSASQEFLTDDLIVLSVLNRHEKPKMVFRLLEVMAQFGAIVTRVSRRLDDKRLYFRLKEGFNV